MAKKNTHTIDDFKDRMTCPLGAKLITPPKAKKKVKKSK